MADRITARPELPELVRILVAGLLRDLRTVEFRVQEGTGMPGWDGIVDAVRETAGCRKDVRVGDGR